MAEPIKKYPKKLRGRETIMVDTQIQNWRRKLKKLGLTSGRHTDKKRADNRKAKDKQDLEEAIVSGKFNFFGNEE